MFLISMFMIGIVIEVLAFYIGQEKSLPVFKQLFMSELLCAKSLILKLNNGEEIKKDEAGFGELASIIGADIVLENPKLKNPSYPIVGDLSTGIGLLHPRWPSVELHGETPEARKRVRVMFNDGGKTEVIYRDLLSAVEKKVGNRVFTFSAFVFLLGILVQIIGFICQPQA